MAIAKHPFTKTLMKPVWIAAFLFVLFSVIVVGITAFRFYHYGPVEHFWDRLLMESYGMLLDVLVIGIFLLWLNLKGPLILFHFFSYLPKLTGTKFSISKASLLTRQ